MFIADFSPGRPAALPVQASSRVSMQQLGASTGICPYGIVLQLASDRLHCCMLVLLLLLLA